MDYSHALARFWLGWAVVSFLTFLVAEVYALCTNWRNTLSAQVWRLLSVDAGEPLGQWSAAHFLFAGIYVTLTVWLAGHFFLGCDDDTGVTVDAWRPVAPRHATPRQSHQRTPRPASANTGLSG
jgi:hypothetical protein